MRINKEYKDFIKELMKSLNYKCRSEVYYRRVGENFVTVDFWINKESQLITYVNYKKYSHDDIYWKILGKEELSKKRDSERLTDAPYRTGPVFHQKFLDNNADQTVIKDRIEYINSTVLPEIENTDINAVILEGDYNDFRKCLALIDTDHTNEAIELSINNIRAGNSGGTIYYGKSFFQLVIERYSDNPTKDMEGLENIKIKDMPEFNQQSVINPGDDMDCFTVDKAEWQYESAKQFISEKLKILDYEYTEDDEKTIMECASNHILMFLTWLIMNDFISEMHFKTDKEKREIEAIKHKEKTSMNFFTKYCDLMLSREDIKDEVLPFVDSYYNSSYFDDYFQVIKEELTTPFSWDDYSQLSILISKAHSKYISKATAKSRETNITKDEQSNAANHHSKKKWYQFWK